jgi:diphosphomevalonate decarboxylase
MKATASAHANIALVKYWGKRGLALNIPAAGSISVTLNDLSTLTTVRFHRDLEKDALILDGAPARSGQLERVGRFLDIVRQDTGVGWFAEVTSENNFPTGAGLASSASAFAALAVAATAALGLEYSPAQLSALARRGSGSAARSIFGGFVEMRPGSRDDGSDAAAVPLFPGNHWPLEILVCITSEAPKPVGSTQAMNDTAATSPFYSAWLESQQEDLNAIREAVENKDFRQLGEVTEHNCLKMHGLALSANPGILYWNPVTLALVHYIRELRLKGVPAYFTIDAGPQVKVLCPPGYAAKIKDGLQQVPGIKQVLVTRPGPGASVH